MEKGAEEGRKLDAAGSGGSGQEIFPGQKRAGGGMLEEVRDAGWRERQIVRIIEIGWDEAKASFVDKFPVYRV